MFDKPTETERKSIEIACLDMIIMSLLWDRKVVRYA